jgi:hypothetical protein
MFLRWKIVVLAVELVKKQDECKLSLDTYFEIIDYFIKQNNAKQQPQEIGKYLHPTKPYKPKEKGSSYTSINKKCEELTRKEILNREYLPCGKKSFRAWYYHLKNDMDFKYFKEIAKYYLDEKSKYYQNKMNFMGTDFVQQYITEDFIKKIGKDSNVVFPEFYYKDLLPSLLSCFPSSLYTALFYENKDYEQLKEKGKEITKKHEGKILYRFLTFIKISMYNDLGKAEYLVPAWWTKIKFTPEVEIFFEYEKDLNDLNLNEIKSLCKKHNIKTANMRKTQLIKSLEKKLKTTKIEEKSETSIIIPGNFQVKFK